MVYVRSRMKIRVAVDEYPDAVLVCNYHARQKRILIPLEQEQLARQIAQSFKVRIAKCYAMDYWLCIISVWRIEEVIQVLEAEKYITKRCKLEGWQERK